MLLRRITEHVKTQNWLAIGIDFVIVVVGVFIGIQVSNWNDARVEREAERKIVERLRGEFQSHESELEVLIGRLARYNEAARQVVVALKTDTPPDDREQMNEWLLDAINLGRPPARSAIYIQLVSSGDFALLSNAELGDLLVRYDQAIERNKFDYDQTLGLLLSTNQYIAATTSNYAEFKNQPIIASRIIHYDFDSLKPEVGKLEWVLSMHSNNLERLSADIELSIVQNEGQAALLRNDIAQ